MLRRLGVAWSCSSFNYENGPSLAVMVYSLSCRRSVRFGLVPSCSGLAWVPVVPFLCVVPWFGLVRFGFGLVAFGFGLCSVGSASVCGQPV